MNLLNRFTIRNLRLNKKKTSVEKYLETLK